MEEMRKRTKEQETRKVEGEMEKDRGGSQTRVLISVPVSLEIFARKVVGRILCGRRRVWK